MSKGIYLVFAAAAYAVFFATFLYLVGFVGDLPRLPRTVDVGPVGSITPAIIVDVALIALFGIQHSVMARQGFKRAWTRVVPKPIERSVYVLLASVALIILFLFWRPIPISVWEVTDPLWQTTLWALFAVGWLIVLLSTFLINHFELFGLQQVYLHARGQMPGAPKFRQPFFYRAVRHPLYSGFFIAFWATPSMSYGHLLLAAGMSAYMLIAIRHEERDLIQLFGTDYEQYRRDVGMLTPRMRRR
jgi:methanethiol S-methyltransferase